MLSKSRVSLSLFLTLLLLPVFAGTQRAQDNDSGFADRAKRAELHQALLDLTNPFTVMCVAAHPDDEDGSTLTVLRRKYGVHTVTLFSTYGEGGQNAVGPELYEELGVIRARETMAAAEVQGSEPYFLGLKDFGFSKSAEETFRAWGEKEALRRMVYQIRRLRPDVIITNHNTTSGHGHHQATGQLIQLAFDAAADPKQFPEQLREVGVWQAQRLFVRGSRQEPDPAKPSVEGPPQQFTIDPNETDPVRNVTYAQQALAGLQKHASQGPWPRTVSPNGARMIRYSLVRQVPSAAPLPDNAASPVDGLRLPASINSGLIAPTLDNKPLTESLDKRTEVLIALVNARKRGAFSPGKEVVEADPQRFKLMSTRLDKALAAAASVSLKAETEEPTLIPGTRNKISAMLANSGEAEVQIKRAAIHSFNFESRLNMAEKVLPETETTARLDISVPKTEKLSVPSAEHLYDSRLFGESIMVNADLAIEGAPFTVSTELHRDITPPVEIISVEPNISVSTPSTALKPIDFRVRLINRMPTEFRGIVRAVGPNLETGREVILRPHASDVFNVSVRSTSPLSRRLQDHADVVVSVDLSIPKVPIHKKNVELIFADALVAPDLVVGYLPSFDSTLAHSLNALGVEAKELKVADISSMDLSKFSTIILDNRTYEAHPELVPVNDRLLEFVEGGGTLVVFYHKANEWNPRQNLAPYELVVGDERVTQEDAPVTFLQPRHPILNTPNKITQADFADWIQERGLYFPRQWDSHYLALLSTHDKGEPALRGGLLVAPYGKGNYIYTSLVWYRQLRAGVPGGYRFFANMISYGKGKSELGKQTVSSTP